MGETATATATATETDMLSGKRDRDGEIKKGRGEGHRRGGDQAIETRWEGGGGGGTGLAPWSRTSSMNVFAEASNSSTAHSGKSSCSTT